MKIRQIVKTDERVTEKSKNLKIRFWAKKDNFSQVSSQRMGKNEKKDGFVIEKD